MPSKGVQVYTFISAPGCEVEYTVPGQNLVRNQLNNFFNDHLEVDKSNIHGLHFTGTFSFVVRQNGREITKQHIEINSLTGNIEGGTMEGLENQRAIVNNDVIVAYGFYDAGQGLAGLPNSEQCYVTVTPNRGNWMGEVAPPGSHQAGQKFSHFVLPAAHDIGMNSMQSAEALIQHCGEPFINTLKGVEKTFAEVAAHVSTTVAMEIAPNIIRALAVTQKDTVDAVMNIGARYFEFRPAHIHSQVLPYSPLPDRLYFQHGPIPGASYQEFLHDVIGFLAAHPAEIAVVQLRWDGVPNECKHPSDQELDEYINTAIHEAAPAKINVGNLDDMRNLSINDLRGQSKRLILLKPVDVYSTYTDEANATLTGDPIIAEFEKLSTEQQGNRPITNIQCQATSTNIRDVIIHSVMTSNVTNSCLLATKAICDSKTLPWIRQHALDHLRGEGLIVVMNDFFDGATADVAIELSRRRLG